MMNELIVTSDKAALRKIAFARRKAAHANGGNVAAQRHLVEFVKGRENVACISAYMPIQTEVDPIPAMTELYEFGIKVAVPVIQGKDMPLLFRQWTPDTAMIEGDFGALIPRGGDTVTPDLLVVPLVAFDGKGNRMGYGGGFYDRTIELLRKSVPLIAVGFAFSGQEFESVPTEPTDQPLDAIITENGCKRFK